MSSEANKKARRPPGYKPFWESEEEEVQEEAKPSYDWSGLKNRVLGNKTAAEVATEEIEKLKKKQNGF